MKSKACSTHCLVQYEGLKVEGPKVPSAYGDVRRPPQRPLGSRKGPCLSQEGKKEAS